jgi:hypothetical protein
MIKKARDIMVPLQPGDEGEEDLRGPPRQGAGQSKPMSQSGGVNLSEGVARRRADI